MLTLAHHTNGAITGRVHYLHGVTRADLPDLLPLLGGPAPLDAEHGVITPSVFCFNAKVHGQEVSLADLFAPPPVPKVEVAPGIWAPAGTPLATLNRIDYKD